MKRIYLDNNATSPLDPQIADQMLELQQQFPGNPSSQHQEGRQARAEIDRMTQAILVAVGAPANGMHEARLIWTSGGTEANSLALRGLVPPSGHLLVAEIEHPSITATAAQMAAEGRAVTKLVVDRDGVVDRDDLREKLARVTADDNSPDDVWVSVMLANNETGVVQPIAEISNICREFGVRVHADAVQAVGKIPVDFSELGVKAMTLAAHKCHGPKGIGGLLLSHDVIVTPQLLGGQQQLGLRAGTECPSLIGGMGLAYRKATSDGEREAHLRRLRDHLENRLSDLSGVQVLGRQVARLPQTSCVAFEGVDRQALFIALDMKGVACSTGSACASGSSEPSPVLTAMGLDPAVVDSAVRFSMGMQNTISEIDVASRCIIETVRSLRGT